MRKVFKYNAINSTNDLMLSWAENDSIANGSIIWAQEQFKGRGQHGRSWESKAGDNLTFSMLIRHDNLNINDQFIFNKAISVAVLKAMQLISPDFLIKWPNDIYLNNKKLVGILIENSIKGKYLSYSVVGIGVNVNQSVFSKDLVNASSLLNETGYKHDLTLLLNQIADHIEFYAMSGLKDAKRRKQIRDLYDNSLYRKDVVAVYQKDSQNFNGIIRGVDTYGRLLLELDDEKLQLFGNGEITFKI